MHTKTRVHTPHASPATHCTVYTEDLLFFLNQLIETQQDVIISVVSCAVIHQVDTSSAEWLCYPTFSYVLMIYNHI